MQLSDGEWRVMNVVWGLSPITARQVLESLGDDTAWAYTTVKTMMSRLVEKGALATHKRANTSVYEPLVSRADARRSAVKSLLERAFDGAFGPMVQFLAADERLSGKDRDALRSLLEHAEADPADSGGENA